MRRTAARRALAGAGWLLLAATAAAEQAPGAPGSELRVGGALLRVHAEAEAFTLPPAALLSWIDTSAAVVSHYYGRFPVPELNVALLPVPGKGIKSGKAFGFDEATINVRVGRQSDRADLAEDWIMVHEMIHFALPRVPRRHHWIEEGLAVYVESVARANLGELSPELVWEGFIKGMPHGLPGSEDQGLDHTPTWGRTYWGGALFCLLADIGIRERTDNRKSLRDALRAIVAAGLSMLDSRPLEPLLRIGDTAVGGTVLMDLYNEHRASARTVDLQALWRRLGVALHEGRVRFDELAPLAAIRRDITARSDPGARSAQAAAGGALPQ